MLIAFLKQADPYSVRMREFLTRKGLDFVEKGPDALPDDLKAPQLFLGDKCLGDYERVTSLDLRGELDALLKQ